jgi:hypothetical protein
MADRDILFGVKNNFYIGAYNNAINEASDLGGLSDAEQTEKDVFVYRSYIAIGSHDVSTSPVLLAPASREQLPTVLQNCCCCWLVLGSLLSLQQNRKRIGSRHQYKLIYILPCTACRPTSAHKQQDSLLSSRCRCACSCYTCQSPAHVCIMLACAGIMCHIAVLYSV